MPCTALSRRRRPDQLSILNDVRKHIHLRILRMGVGLDEMQFEIAETSRKGELLWDGDLLIAKKDDRVIQQRVMDLGKIFVGQRH